MISLVIVSIALPVVAMIVIVFLLHRFPLFTKLWKDDSQCRNSEELNRVRNDPWFQKSSEASDKMLDSDLLALKYHQRIKDKIERLK